MQRADDRDIAIFMEDINRFIGEQKALLEHLKTFKTTLKDIVPLKQAERAYYQSFSNFLEKYEESKQKKSGAVGELAHVRLISGPGQGYLKDKINHLAEDFQNPFLHISHWVKGEVYSLEALTNSVNIMHDLPNQKKKTLEEIKDIEETVVKLQSGKFTWGGLLKNDQEKKQSIVNKEILKAELQ